MERKKEEERSKCTLKVKLFSSGKNYEVEEMKEVGINFWWWEIVELSSLTTRLQVMEESIETGSGSMRRIEKEKERERERGERRESTSGTSH